MRRILATLIVLALSASYAHATNRFIVRKNTTRRPAPLTTKNWDYKPYVYQPAKTRRPEVRSHTSRRPNVPVPVSTYKVTVTTPKTRRPLVYPISQGTQFPTPEDPK